MSARRKKEGFECKEERRWSKEGDDPFIRTEANRAGFDGRPGKAEEAGGLFGTR